MSETSDARPVETDPVPLTLPKAFSKAQGAFGVPKKTKHYLIQNKPVHYADLADVIDAVRKPLADNGLSITHRLGFCKGPFGLTTVLMHESGDSIETWYPLPDASKVKAQEFGGALTYARRYSLSAILGIASDEDTDGQGAPQADASKGKDQNPKPSGNASKIQPSSNGPRPISITKEPGDYVMQNGGEGVAGRKLKDLDYGLLLQIRDWSEKGTKNPDTPKPKLPELIEILHNVRAELRVRDAAPTSGDQS